MRLVALPILALAACAPVTSAVLDVDGPFAVVAPDCASASTPLGVGVLDLASGPTNYFAIFVVPGDRATLVARADLSYSLERGDFDDAALRAPIETIPEGCSDCQFAVDEAFIPLITEATTARLAGDAAVDELVRENGRVRLEISALLHGLQSAVSHGGYGTSPPKQTAVTTSINASVDLCSGCLAGPSACANGAAPVPNPAQCIAGVDVPNKVCP